MFYKSFCLIRQKKYQSDFYVSLEKKQSILHFLIIKKSLDIKIDYKILRKGQAQQLFIG